MFLRERATQAEYFDGPERTTEELRRHYAELARVNRLTRFERPFRLWLPRLLGSDHCRTLSLLDLGAGEGLLGRELTAWAATRGWQWRFTNLDHCHLTAQLAGNTDHVVASATELPFPDGSFEVVLATSMTHHLPSEAAVIAHFREAARVARRAVLICDLHRNSFFQFGLWLLLLGASREFRADAVLSVKRGWRVGEWRRLADAAGLTGANVWAEHGTRVLLSLVK